MKVIIFGIEKGKKVYNQEVQIIEKKKIIFCCNGSSTPNPYYYKDPGQKGLKAYPYVRGNTYTARYSKNAHNGGPGLDIENNRPIPIIQKVNPRTGARGTANHIDIHSGYSDTWKGSAGCFTIEPKNWKEFVAFFKEGEECRVIIPEPDIEN